MCFRAGLTVVEGEFSAAIPIAGVTASAAVSVYLMKALPTLPMGTSSRLISGSP
jgi:hypothetical protein